MSYGQGGGRGYGRRGGYGSFGPRNFSPKPVKAGEEYDVEITEIGRRGDGIAKIQGFIILVAGAKGLSKELSYITPNVIAGSVPRCVADDDRSRTRVGNFLMFLY